MVEPKVRKEILDHYQHARGSIQDLARIYHISVDEVLGIIGAPELGVVTSPGDLIDVTEAGPGAAMNYGKEHKIPFTTD